MCGRYYVDDETAREIEKLIRQVDKKLRQESIMAVQRIAAKNIYPTEIAPVLFMAGCCRQYEVAEWILKDEKAETILHKTLYLLERKSDYQQISLF